MKVEVSVLGADLNELQTEFDLPGVFCLEVLKHDKGCEIAPIIKSATITYSF